MPAANALIILNRIAFFDTAQEEARTTAASGPCCGWACEHKLGQDDVLVADVARRRDAALRALSAGPARRPCYRLRLRAEPEWRLAVGLGNNANAHEIGLALHGTYGWPVIPGSALKGLAAAWAVSASVGDRSGRRAAGARRAARRHVARPPDAESQRPPPPRGTVCFLDAIPAGQPVVVEADVLTPHVKPYYDGIAARRGTSCRPPSTTIRCR